MDPGRTGGGGVKDGSYEVPLEGGVRKRGLAGGLLDNKGFGWLLEVNDEDMDASKPLL